MIIVKIPFTDGQWEASARAIAMSKWCRDNGLEDNKHFDWAFRSNLKEIHFRFYSDEESLATMFAMIWVK
jgi:hypothetical protein